MNRPNSSIENLSIPEMGTPVGGSGLVSSSSPPSGSGTSVSMEDSTTVEGGGGTKVEASPGDASGRNTGHTGAKGLT